MNNKNGDVVDVSVDTEYPWDGNVTIKTWTVSSSAYNVHLRIPSWAGGSTVAVNRSEPKTVQAGKYKILLHFQMDSFSFLVFRDYHSCKLYW